MLILVFMPALLPRILYISTQPCALKKTRRTVSISTRCNRVAKAVIFGLAGVTQRAIRSGVAAVGRGQGGPHHGTYPCFHAVPESQPVLPCLLRRLLQKSKTEVRPSHHLCSSGQRYWSRRHRCVPEDESKQAEPAPICFATHARLAHSCNMP